MDGILNLIMGYKSTIWVINLVFSMTISHQITKHLPDSVLLTHPKRIYTRMIDALILATLV
jgi:hypothetical protein